MNNEIQNERLDAKIEATRNIIKVIEDFAKEKGISNEVTNELINRIKQL